MLEPVPLEAPRAGAENGILGDIVERIRATVRRVRVPDRLNRRSFSSDRSPTRDSPRNDLAIPDGPAESDARRRRGERRCRARRQRFPMRRALAETLTRDSDAARRLRPLRQRRARVRRSARPESRPSSAAAASVWPPLSVSGPDVDAMSTARAGQGRRMPRPARAEVGADRARAPRRDRSPAQSRRRG